jgi:putative ABC transport system permease protein
MRRVALRGLAARKLRAVLTAIAIVLGVAMVSGTLILTDTIDRAFTRIFTTSYKNTDAVVTGRPIVADAASGAPTVPAALLPRIRALPGVRAAAGSMIDVSGMGSTAKIIGHDGKPISTNAPNLGFGVNPAYARFNPMTLTSGRWAAGPDQVVLDVGTADDHGLRMGERVGIAGDGPVRRYRVVGLARFGDVDSLGGATIAVFDVPTARRVLGKTGFDAISIAARPGVSTDALIAQVRPLLPAAAQIQSGDARAESDGKDVSEAVDFIRWFLLAFGAIALFVGAFVIFNTLSITVAQRTREFATLRTLGASRRQVMRSVALEALVIGLAASIAGLALGVGLAKGLSALFGAFGLSMPEAGTVVSGRTIVVSLLVGVLVTLVAGIVPAVRATRVPPIAAVREGAPPSGGRRGLLPGAIVTALAALVLGFAILAGDLGAGARLLGVAVGTLALFVGVAMLAPRLVRPLAALVGWPAARLAGTPGRLARENAVRNPGRTASTAAALMIGLALVTFVAVLGASLKDSDREAISSQIRSDHVVTAQDGFTPLPLAAGRAVAAAPGVVVATSVRTDQAKANGHAVTVTGVDPRTIARGYAFRWSAGSAEALIGLDSGGAIVQKGFAGDHGLGLGDRVHLLTPSGSTIDLTVAAVDAPPRLAPLLGEVVISQGIFDRTFPRPQDRYTFLDVRPGSEAAARAALAGVPDADLRTREGYVEKQSGNLDVILNLLYVLLALSVVVSLFGMVNTLVLAVFERTRELGMLRAVGMTRAQTRSMVRHESVITALIGGALGIPLGLLLAALVVRSMSGYDVGYSVPVGTLVAFAAIAVAAGVLAAILPARRAAALRPLEALQYQ